MVSRSKSGEQDARKLILLSQKQFLQASQNGYRPGAYKDIDSQRGVKRYAEKPIRDQDQALGVYKRWQIGLESQPSKLEGLSLDEIDARYLYKGCSAPKLEQIKEFARYKVSLSKGHIVELTTAHSVCTFMEWFFAGFTRRTGAIFSEEDKSEVYKWIREELVAEGLVSFIKKKKFNCKKEDHGRLLETALTLDDAHYVYERCRLQFIFVLQMYASSGARVKAFFKKGFGVQWRDVEIALIRRPNGEPSWTFRSDQRHVKNNKNPEDVTFGNVNDEDLILRQDACLTLLAMGTRDGAFVGDPSLDDILQKQIPKGKDYLHLLIKPGKLRCPILRNFTKSKGLTQDPWPEHAFSRLLRSVARIAGYSVDITIHAIRREVGNRIDERATETQRGQHITQTNPRVFSEYVANCSSVQGADAFYRQCGDGGTSIRFWQGFDQFREPGLPYKLPPSLARALGPDASCQEKAQALRKHRTEWLTERRTYLLKTNGAVEPIDPPQNFVTQRLFEICPPRQRLAQQMSSTDPMNKQQRERALRDLYDLCGGISFGFKGLPMQDETCKSCGIDLLRHSPPAKQKHLLSCLRGSLAQTNMQKSKNVHFCWFCDTWLVGHDQWLEHCSIELERLATQCCGLLQHEAVTLKPAFCPCCIGDTMAPSDIRLKQWFRESDLRVHIAGHLSQATFPGKCPHPLCHLTADSAIAMMDHFVEFHGLRHNSKMELEAPATSLTQLNKEKNDPPDTSEASYFYISENHQKRERENEHDPTAALQPQCRTGFKRRRVLEIGNRNKPAKPINFISQNDQAQLLSGRPTWRNQMSENSIWHQVEMNDKDMAATLLQSENDTEQFNQMFEDLINYSDSNDDGAQGRGDDRCVTAAPEELANQGSAVEVTSTLSDPASYRHGTPRYAKVNRSRTVHIRFMGNLVASVQA